MAKGKIKIIEKYCKGCLLCIDACKFQEIIISKKINKFGNNIVEFKDTGNCTACSLCAQVCPDAAIEVSKIIEE
jgi:2-oxoglutarate ferredoxin oxidoreductase subunit delta